MTTLPKDFNADLYIAETKRGERYRTMCYWFAAGYERCQRDALKDESGNPLPGYWDVVDHSDRFSRYGAWMADRYEAGDIRFLPSIIDMFKTFKENYA